MNDLGTIARDDNFMSTLAAAERPSAMAHTMRDGPRPASPATNTPSALLGHLTGREILPQPIHPNDQPIT
jgi:hypothetical protein